MSQQIFLEKFQKIKQQNIYPIAIVAKLKGNTFFSRVISFFSNSPIIHTEILLSDNITTIASRNFEGVGVYSINDEYLSNYIIYDLNDVFTDEMKIKFYEYFDILGENNHLEYDVMSILSVVFNKYLNPVNYKHKYYCSELIYDCFKYCGCTLINDNHEYFNSVVYPSVLCSSIKLTRR